MEQKVKTFSLKEAKIIASGIDLDRLELMQKIIGREDSTLTARERVVADIEKARGVDLSCDELCQVEGHIQAYTQKGAVEFIEGCEEAEKESIGVLTKAREVEEKKSLERSKQSYLRHKREDFMRDVKELELGSEEYEEKFSKFRNIDHEANAIAFAEQMAIERAESEVAYRKRDRAKERKEVAEFYANIKPLTEKELIQQKLDEDKGAREEETAELTEEFNKKNNSKMAFVGKVLSVVAIGAFFI